MYQIGDNVILADGLQKFFNEVGPHLIIGQKSDQYIILSRNGWALKSDNIEKYGVDPKYIKHAVWIVDRDQIVKIAPIEQGAKCQRCGTVCAWNKMDIFGRYTCQSCLFKPARYYDCLN